MKPSTPVSAAETARYAASLQDTLLPLARLLIAKGLTYPAFEDLLQRAYVQAATEWFVGEESKATASRLYMLTGIHRKKIAPLQQPSEPLAGNKPLSLQVFDQVTGEARLLDRRGRVKPIKVSRREGGELSFEALVERVSKDIRPRAVLDQWLQAGLARLDEAGQLSIDIDRSGMIYPPGEEAGILDRVLRPTTLAIVNSLLQTGLSGSTLTVRVEGLSEANAKALAQEARGELKEAMLRINKRAEKLAAKARLSGQGGECVLLVGAHDWIDGQQESRPAPSATPPLAQAAGEAAAPTTKAKPLPRRRSARLA